MPCLSSCLYYETPPDTTLSEAVDWVEAEHDSRISDIPVKDLVLNGRLRLSNVASGKIQGSDYSLTVDALLHLVDIAGDMALNPAMTELARAICLQHPWSNWDERIQGILASIVHSLELGGESERNARFIIRKDRNSVIGFRSWWSGSAPEPNRALKVLSQCLEEKIPGEYELAWCCVRGTWTEAAIHYRGPGRGKSQPKPGTEAQTKVQKLFSEFRPGLVFQVETAPKSLVSVETAILGGSENPRSYAAADKAGADPYVTRSGDWEVDIRRATINALRRLTTNNWAGVVRRYEKQLPPISSSGRRGAPGQSKTQRCHSLMSKLQLAGVPGSQAEVTAYNLYGQSSYPTLMELTKELMRRVGEERRDTRTRSAIARAALRTPIWM